MSRTKHFLFRVLFLLFLFVPFTAAWFISTVKALGKTLWVTAGLLTDTVNL